MTALQTASDVFSVFLGTLRADTAAVSETRAWIRDQLPSTS